MDRSHEHGLDLIATALQEDAYPHVNRRPSITQTGAAVRFVTVSRQAGAGGQIVGEELCKAINRLTPDADPWCAWDHALVDKVANEHHIQGTFVDSWEDADHHWFSEFIKPLSFTGSPDDFKIYRRIAVAIRTLAGAGRAVIVGRGGVFITAGMPGGLHIRLVAPTDFRIRRIAERRQISTSEAAKQVHESDRNRSSFYHQYWPTRNIAPETFAVTFNTAEVSEQQIAACLLPLINDQKREQS